jgi:2-polyprenyl-3-methyl-5-hydroxy-6-metoxy-1,4-benzoquinol methylase
MLEQSIPLFDQSAGHIYRNSGNAPLIDLLDEGARQILDVGCGAGDNAALIRSRFPDCEVHGVTLSAAEREIARHRMSSCEVWDIEGDIPSELSGVRFDAIIFSHVLEHLRSPEAVVAKFAHLLRPGGSVIVAVPNAVSWTTRWQILRGDFEYQSEGVLDRTHLRFFTYHTADKYLISGCLNLRLVAKNVTGNVPLWILRRHLLPRRACEFVDAVACRIWPNLFGSQVLLKAIYDPANRCT